jgi:ion channel
MLQDRNVWITVCFAIYLVLIALFGAVYYGMYRRRPQRFIFALGIQDAQRGGYTETTSRRIAALTAENEALKQIESRLDKGATPQALAEQKTGGTLPSGAGFTLYLADPAGSARKTPTLELSDPDGTVLARVVLPTGWPWQRWDDVFPRRRYRNQATITLLETRLKTLPTSPHDIWSYWDFLYFSAVSQTTVGFGDILPNATSIRLLVVGQIILGYSLLVVLLNMVFRR